MLFFCSNWCKQGNIVVKQEHETKLFQTLELFEFFCKKGRNKDLIQFPMFLCAFGSMYKFVLIPCKSAQFFFWIVLFIFCLLATSNLRDGIEWFTKAFWLVSFRIVNQTFCCNFLFKFLNNIIQTWFTGKSISNIRDFFINNRA